MTFPRRVLAALEEVGSEGLSGVLALDGKACAGAKFHSPTPLLLNEVEVGGGTILLCGTCQANLSVLQHLLVQNDGNLPWPVRREFGNFIRAIALQGWQADSDDGDEVESA